MKIIRPAIAGLLLCTIGLVGWAQVDPNGEWQIPGDHYLWLLNAPVRPYLSSAAEEYLGLKYGGVPVDQTGDQKDPGELNGFDQRVNNPAEDKNPSRTTQSETTISIFGQNVVVG